MCKVKQIIIILSLIFFSVSIPISGQENCFTIVVGKEVSGDGSVLLAHNEDDAGDNLLVNIHKMPGRSYSENELIQLKNNGTLPQVKQTYGFLWIQIPGVDFADGYINDNGVVIVSDACYSREDNPELVNGGIGFMLRRIMAEQAVTARNAVEIAGKLVEQLGYYSSGRSYIIADPTEAWVLHIVKGKHWVAKKVPNNRVMVIANRYVIEDVNLSDTKNYLGSSDIIDYAVKRGWYSPDKDGKFNFARVYSSPGNYTAEANVLRQWRGTALLAKKRFKVDDPLPFSFQPRKKVSLSDLFTVLRDHYEETEYDLTSDYRNGSPNKSGKRTICTETTRYSMVAQLRDDLPKEIAHVVWLAFRRPDSNAYSPWYTSLTSPPEGYCRGDSLAALENHFKQPKSFFKYDRDFAYWSFAKLSQLVDQNYKPRIKIARKEWRNFENYLLKTQKKMEKEFQYFSRKNKNIAQKIISNYVNKWEYRKWFLADQMIEELGK